MWNLNLLLRAYVRKGGYSQLLLLLISRFALLNLIALLAYLLSRSTSLERDSLMLAQTLVALVFILGFPLMRKLGIAPFDLSLQFFFPKKSFQPGLALGLSLPYCSLPFIALLVLYSIHFKEPFLIFNLYALFVSLPLLGVVLVGDRTLKLVSSLIPAVPVITGFSLILALGLFLEVSELNLYISSLLRERHSVFFLIPLMFFLGFFTSLGPSTLPFLPVVFGFIVSKHESIRDIALSVGGFSLAFLLTHVSVGVVATLGTVVLSEIFKTGLFNLLLALFLLLVALNLLNLFSFSVEIAKISPFSHAGGSSFLLGVVYTFSLCPSCTSLLLGALVLSASTGNLPFSALLMGIYALGRAVPVFLSGLVVSSLREFLQRNYRHVNRAVGFLFLALSLYFFKNFLEVSL